MTIIEWHFEISFAHSTGQLAEWSSQSSYLRDPAVRLYFQQYRTLLHSKSRRREQERHSREQGRQTYRNAVVEQGRFKIYGGNVDVSQISRKDDRSKTISSLRE